MESGGASAVVSYAAEEQIYYVLDGDGVLLYGDERATVKKDDFLYLRAGVKHGLANTSGKPVRAMVMGFRIPTGTKVAATPRLMLANAGDVPLTTLASHGPTTQFKLLMGTTGSKRDKLAAASQMVSLFLMDFAPGGTNIPHHHDMEEEIYYILRGSGEMVAGGGADGNEGRYPARAGDAFFIRPPLHLACDLVAFNAALCVLFLFAWRFRRDPLWRGWTAYSFLTAVAMMALLLGFGMANHLGGPAGLMEKLATIVRTTWSVLFVSRLLAGARLAFTINRPSTTRL